MIVENHPEGKKVIGKNGKGGHHFYFFCHKKTREIYVGQCLVYEETNMDNLLVLLYEMIFMVPTVPSIFLVRQFFAFGSYLLDSGNWNIFLCILWWLIYEIVEICMCLKVEKSFDLLKLFVLLGNFDELGEWLSILGQWMNS